MIRIKKQDIKKISYFFGAISRQMADHFFRAVFIILLVNLIIGGILFYKYNFLIQNRIIEISPDILKFREDIYQKILVIWSEREKRFNESGSKIYLNPFKAPVKELTK